MPDDTRDLVAWLDQAQSDPAPMPEILEAHPELTAREAYALQLAVMDARVGRGDRIVGL